MEVRLVEVDDANRDAVLALRVALGQERFVGSVGGALRDATAFPFAKPWYRAVVVGDEPVGFIMVSWNVEPDPPDLIGPWFLWKLMIDRSRQGLGYGAQAVRLVADVVRAAGATELLTSYVDEPGGPSGFYARLGFEPTGDVDGAGEVIARLRLDDAVRP